MFWRQKHFSLKSLTFRPTRNKIFLVLDKKPHLPPFHKLHWYAGQKNLIRWVWLSRHPTKNPKLIMILTYNNPSFNMLSNIFKVTTFSKILSVNSVTVIKNKMPIGPPGWINITIQVYYQGVLGRHFHLFRKQLHYLKNIKTGKLENSFLVLF